MRHLCKVSNVHRGVSNCPLAFYHRRYHRHQNGNVSLVIELDFCAGVPLQPDRRGSANSNELVEFAAKMATVSSPAVLDQVSQFGRQLGR